MIERSQWRRAVRRLHVVQRGIDERVTVDRVERETSKRVACAEGCSHCCRQLASASIPEALGIVFELAEDCDALERVRSRADRVVERLMLNPATLEQWFALQVDCVLLERGRCITYGSRPVGCRLLFALETSERCVYGAPDPNPERVDASALSRAATVELLVLASDLRLPISQIPLPLALRWALVIYDHGLDELRRRLAGTSFEHDMETMAFWVERLHGQSAG